MESKFIKKTENKRIEWKNGKENEVQNDKKNAPNRVSKPVIKDVLKVQRKPIPKKPVTAAVSSNISVRRGHKEGSGHPDNLSRTSSVTNLDSLETNPQQAKGAKPRKASSKERIDKQQQDAKKQIPKNNNKLEPTPLQAPPLTNYSSSDSLQEAELQQLRKQLRDMADEKSSLALQLGEHRGQLSVLQKEIQKLRCFQEESNVEMEKLAEENTALRNRLRDVAHSPLSDNEKQQLLFESRHHSSAPASIATNVAEENLGDVTACPTPDWDKHSSSNVSEVSVACLQDKINQMQETHYSTNEELQATLQELTDLQRQLTELQHENERLNEEKTLMFDSLCRQTERLTDSRQEVENLKQFLYRDKTDETGANQFESAVEREQKLVELLRSAQDEREQLLLKLEQIQADLHEARTSNLEKSDNVAQLSERVRTLECSLDAKHAEHRQLDQELAQAKDHCSGKQIEINRLSDLLENARTKINELEQDRTLSDKSELDELLDNARKEKDQLESEVAYLKEQLARSKNETEKLKEQVSVLQEECKVTRNNAKTTQSDLEYKCEKLVVEKAALTEQLQQFQEAVNELQLQGQCHLEDKRQLSAVLSETQRNLSEAERRNVNLENDIQELKKLRQEENDEWEKFQNDLLTSVRVANDFKTEAQQELQKIILENKTFRERVRLLEGQIDKLKGDKLTVATQTDVILTPQLVALVRNVDPNVSNRISLLEHPPQDGPTMEKLFPILSKERKSRSKENLAEPGLKRTKSKDNLAEEEGLLKRSRSKESLEEPHHTKKAGGGGGFFKRSKSKDNLEELSSTDSTKPTDYPPRRSLEAPQESSQKSEFFSKFTIKKRDKKTSKAHTGHRKTLSVEEKTLLQSLESWYENIDQSLPDECLSKEELAIRKLKTLYEDDVLKEKPVAHKPKEQLAISKPLLNSVVQNPKLEEIVRNPKVLPVESEVRESALEQVCTLEDKKSKSLDDLQVFEATRTSSSLAPALHRATLQSCASEIYPNDSVSNPRYSHTDLPKPKVHINYENLDEIVRTIPKGAPQSKLSDEQKFALKLKLALEEAERKTTPKKKKKRAFRGVEISGPTRESVEKNWKLKEILLNPAVRKAAEEQPRKKRNSTNLEEIVKETSSGGLNRHKPTSKSYDDITFSFQPQPSVFQMYFGNSEENLNSSSSSRSFTSAEFNLDTGTITQPFQPPPNEDLLYNETITKTKKKHKHEKDEESGFRDVEEKYKSDLKLIVKRIQVDELRRSLKKKTFESPGGELSDVYVVQPKEDQRVEPDEEEENDRSVDDIVDSRLSKGEASVEGDEGQFEEKPKPAQRARIASSLDNPGYARSPETEENREGQFDEKPTPAQRASNVSSHQQSLKNHEEHEETPPPVVGKPPPLDAYAFSRSDWPLACEETKTEQEEVVEKEDKYGVVSPTSLRQVYRTVVKEYKHKYPPEEEGQEEVDYIAYEDNFVDEFFEPVQRQFDLCEAEDVVVRRNEDSASQIDKEMQEIMHRYLNTRASLLVKTSGGDKVKNEAEEPADGSKMKEEEAKEAGVSKVVIENKDFKAVELEDDHQEPLSLEDLKFIEEMTSKYSFNEEEHDPEEPSSQMKEKIEKEHQDSTGGRKEEALPEISEQDIQEKFENLTEEELALIRSAKGERFSRPLSAPNAKDLLMVEEVSRRYFQSDTSATARPNSSPVKRGDLMFNETIFVPLSQENSRQWKTEGSLVAPRELGKNSTWRTTWDLSYKETIVVPHLLSSDVRNVTLDKMTDSNGNFSKPTTKCLQGDVEIDDTKQKTGSDDSESMTEPSKPTASSSTLKSSASIAVSSKNEQLDLTRSNLGDSYVLEEDVEEISRPPSGVDDSNVNLFSIDADSYDSYLELFKTKESKEFDDLRGKKPVRRGFIGGPFVHEESAEETTSAASGSDDGKPKIVDFVPLDDKTTPYFTKEDDNKEYDTLEREKTFHVLSQAAKMDSEPKNEDEDEDKTNLECFLEVSSSKTSSSFTKAKKLFEALVEANKEERPRSEAGARASSKSYLPRDSKSLHGGVGGAESAELLKVDK